MSCVRALLSFEKTPAFQILCFCLLDIFLLTFKSDLGTVLGKVIRSNGTEVIFFWTYMPPFLDPLAIPFIP